MNHTSPSTATTTWQNPLNHVYKTIENSATNVVDYYKWLESFADPRVADWPLMSGPAPILAAFFLYLYVANKGPKWMEQKRALKLRLLLIVYNLSLAYLNAWIAIELIYCVYKLRWNSLCQLVNVTNNPYELRMANVIWWYWASKGFEFADTLFFIVRKKNNQLSFLHKYHHSTMFLIWWVAARFVPGGSVVIPVTCNSFVHVLMYSYYGLSAIPSMQKFLWWKKHLTMIQLIQFVIGVTIGSRLIMTSCPFPRWMTWVFGTYTFSFIILFGNFYIQTYKNRSKSSDNNFKDSASSKSTQQNNKAGNIMDGSCSSIGQNTVDIYDEDAEAILRQRKNHKQINQTDKSKQQLKLI